MTSAQLSAFRSATCNAFAAPALDGIGKAAHQRNEHRSKLGHDRLSSQPHLARRTARRLQRRVEGLILWLNLFYLMSIGLIPFSTSVMSGHGSVLATILYAGVLVVTGMLSAAMWWHASRNDELMDKDVPPALRREGTLKPLLVAAVFLLSMAVAACFATSAIANPVAPVVVNGMASFNQAGNVLTVTNSNGAAINWNTFSIAAGETTRFVQPSASSSVLNRVLGGACGCDQARNGKRECKQTAHWQPKFECYPTE